MRIDQRAEAKKVGLSLRPTELLLFGNPEAGTPLMVAQPTITAGENLSGSEESKTTVPFLTLGCSTPAACNGANLFLAIRTVPFIAEDGTV